MNIFWTDKDVVKMSTVLRHNGKRITFFPRSERVNPSFFIFYKFFPSQFFSYFFSTFTLIFPLLFHFSHSLIFYYSFPIFVPPTITQLFFSFTIFLWPYFSFSIPLRLPLLPFLCFSVFSLPLSTRYLSVGSWWPVI